MVHFPLPGACANAGATSSLDGVLSRSTPAAPSSTAPPLVTRLPQRSFGPDVGCRQATKYTPFQATDGSRWSGGPVPSARSFPTGTPEASIRWAITSTCSIDVGRWSHATSHPLPSDATVTTSCSPVAYTPTGMDADGVNGPVAFTR